MRKPLVIELFAGRMGWSRGFVVEGWRSIGFDIMHESYHGDVPADCELVLQDVLTLHGSQFRNADMIVASPPCQAYSYRAMPWKRAKALPPPSNELFDACFRIQREASQAAGRYIPMVVENVKGAQPWVGRAKWHYGSYYLWGDVPALMPPVISLRSVSKNAATQGGSWFNYAHGCVIPGNQAGAPQRGDGLKTVGHANIRDGHTHPRHLTNQQESDGLKVPGIKLSEIGFNVAAAQRYREGVKQAGLSGPAWFDGGMAGKSSRSDSRKAASAAIAEIPFELSSYIARVFRP